MGQGCQGLCLKLPVTCTRVFGHQKMPEMGAQTLTQLQSDLMIGRKKFDLYKYTSICNRTTIEMIGRNLCVQGLISSSYPHPEDIYTAHCTNIAQILQEIYNCVTQAQTCCLFQQCSLLHIVSAIDWGHMCFDSPHTQVHSITPATHIVTLTCLFQIFANLYSRS